MLELEAQEDGIQIDWKKSLLVGSSWKTVARQCGINYMSHEDFLLNE